MPATRRLPKAGDFARLCPTRPKDDFPWLLSSFCLLLLVIPSYYRSPLLPFNLSTPARLVGAALLLSVFLEFLFPRHRIPGAVRVNVGILHLTVYLAVLFIIWGLGFRIVGTPSQELSKATSISGSLLATGVGISAVIQLGSGRKRAIVLGSLLVGLAYSSLVGVAQHIAQVNLEGLLKPPGFEAGLDAYQGLPERGGLVRAFGSVGSYLVLGALSAAAVPLAIHFTRYSSNRARRLSAGFAALVLLASIPMTLSRSALISLAVSLAFYFALSRIRLIFWVATTVSAVGLVMVLTYPQTIQVLSDTISNSAQDYSILARVRQIEAMRAIIVEHPVSGLGLGAITLSDYGPIDNYLFFALAEGGIVWAIGFATLVIGAVIAIALAIRFSATPVDRDRILAVGAMLAGLLAVSPNFATLSYDPIFFIFFLLIGILWAACPKFSRTEGWVISSGE